MESPARILVVDDEQSIRFALEAILTRDGYEVVTADSGECALGEIASQPFDVMLLDLKLDGMGGLDVLADLRQQSLDTAVIVLTAHGTMETAIEALRNGAHDYLLKPCRAACVRESVRSALLEREREQRRLALLRQVEQSLSASLDEIRSAVDQPARTQPDAATATRVPSTRGATNDGLVVDLQQRIVTLEGHTLPLSSTEFELLAYLVASAPNVVRHQELVEHVQGYACDRFESADIVRHHVHRIRQKAKAAAGHADFIRTVRGVGYALNP